MSSSAVERSFKLYGLFKMQITSVGCTKSVVRKKKTVHLGALSYDSLASPSDIILTFIPNFARSSLVYSNFS